MASTSILTEFGFDDAFGFLFDAAHFGELLYELIDCFGVDKFIYHTRKEGGVLAPYITARRILIPVPTRGPGKLIPMVPR